MIKLNYFVLYLHKLDNLLHAFYIFRYNLTDFRYAVLRFILIFQLSLLGCLHWSNWVFWSQYQCIRLEYDLPYCHLGHHSVSSCFSKNEYVILVWPIYSRVLGTSTLRDFLRNEKSNIWVRTSVTNTIRRRPVFESRTSLYFVTGATKVLRSRKVNWTTEDQLILL